MRQLLLPLVLVALSCLSTTPKAESLYRVEGYQLENGLQVLLKAVPGTGHVAIRLVVGVGFDQYNCAEKELPHLFEHLLFSGTDDSGEAGVEARMQALGGVWNAYTRDTDTTVTVEAPARNQRAVLDLMLANLTQSEPDSRKLAAAKLAVEHESGVNDSPLQHVLLEHNIGREAHQQIAQELGLACAQPATAADLTLQQVNGLRADWYVANNMTLIVVGDLDSRLPAYIDRQYGSLPAAELPAPRQQPEPNSNAQQRRQLISRLYGEDGSLAWMFSEPWLDHHDFETWELLRDYIDWQLYQQLRIKHSLTYAPFTEREVFSSSSFFSLNAKVQSKDLPKAEKVMRELLADLRKNGVDAEVFQRLQSAAVAEQSWAVQGASDMADYYWGALADYDGSHFADSRKSLQSVTVEDANKALSKLLDQPGYLRISKPLLNTYGVYWLSTALLLLILILLGLAIWRRR
ncbi:MAG: insulinase family protein [Pseudomonas marincola]|uniref:M16 family metallopeptidase n=1 Tax=Pseudomonas marincola TaxID=437900 RepID=UPI0030013705